MSYESAIASMKAREAKESTRSQGILDTLITSIGEQGQEMSRVVNGTFIQLCDYGISQQEIISGVSFLLVRGKCFLSEDLMLTINPEVPQIVS